MSNFQLGLLKKLGHWSETLRGIQTARTTNNWRRWDGTQQGSFRQGLQDWRKID